MLHRYAGKLKRLIEAACLPLITSPNHIVPVLNRQCALRQGDHRRTDGMERHGIYVQPINYSTVPKGRERLRLTPEPLHDETHMELLIEALMSDVVSVAA